MPKPPWYPLVFHAFMPQVMKLSSQHPGFHGRAPSFGTSLYRHPGDEAGNLLARHKCFGCWWCWDVGDMDQTISWSCMMIKVLGDIWGDFEQCQSQWGEWWMQYCPWKHQSISANHSGNHHADRCVGIWWVSSHGYSAGHWVLNSSNIHIKYSGLGTGQVDMRDDFMFNGFYFYHVLSCFAISIFFGFIYRSKIIYYITQNPNHI